jgi:GH25 family lysozyme M1 (1,4-beta-N-acetylmuramidase)
MDYEDVKITPAPPRPDENETLIWLKYVEANYRKPVVYTSRIMWFQKLVPAITENFRLAVANYTAALKPTLPFGWSDWLFWQYSAKGDGIAHGVKSKEIDMDRIRSKDWELLTGQHVMTDREMLLDHERRLRILEGK